MLEVGPKSLYCTVVGIRPNCDKSIEPIGLQHCILTVLFVLLYTAIFEIHLDIFISIISGRNLDRNLDALKYTSEDFNMSGNFAYIVRILVSPGFKMAFLCNLTSIDLDLNFNTFFLKFKLASNSDIALVLSTMSTPPIVGTILAVISNRLPCM